MDLMMKRKWLTILFFSSIVLQSVFAQNPGDSVFTGIQVHTINLQFDQPDYWDSLTTYYDEGNEQNIVATATIDGVVIDSIGVRFKGNSSYSHPNNKKPFKINFDEYRDDQRWDALKGIHLNNCWNDPTFMREKIHLDFCQDAGITAPRSNYAELYINDELWGFYSLVEQVDKKFLSSHYDSSDGNLYKAVDAFGGGGMGGSQLISDFRWYGSDQSSYHDRYELKTEELEDPWSGLVNLIDTINNSTSISESLPQVFNVNSFYKAIGADILFANLDSYIDGGRNFYVYKNPVTGKFEWIVWDAGLSFGAYGGGGMGSNSNSSGLSVTYVTSAASRPLAGKIFNDAALKTKYLQSLCYLFNTYFNSERLFAQIDSIANTIRPYVAADPRKQYTIQQFETNINSDITSGGGQGGGSKPGLKSFITARVTNVQNQMVSLSVSCLLNIELGDLVINEFMSSNDSIPDPAGEAEDWIEIYNNSSEEIDISGIYISDDFSNPDKWQFPENTVVAANGYLIIWADEDDGQEGLHANFKLSSTDGEEIILSNSDLTVIDSVSFESQALNLSMSRIPNGTGPFVQTNPTFNKENSNTTLVDESTIEIPGTFTLKQNYPNPFNPTTTIVFTVDKSKYTTLRVYNVLGQLIETLYEGYANPGSLYSTKFDASKLNSGVYFYRLESNENVKTRRMVLIK